MVKIPVQLGKASYDIEIGVGVWERLTHYTEGYDRVVVIIDSHLDRLYGDKLDYEKIHVLPGETSKNLGVATQVLEGMLTRKLTRRSLVIAVGGGVVGDIAGFCASTYMRGIDIIHLPTTLLSQVDSSIGGKTAVNSRNAKNLIGTYHQPRAVLIDPTVLSTLPHLEIINGLGEVVKYGLIANPDLLEYLKSNLSNVMKIDYETMLHVITECCRVKAEIISADEKEHGVRKKLNLGHTIGHALEAVTDYMDYSHGEAVLIGMMHEARIAHNLGLLPETEYQKIRKYLGLLPVNWDLSRINIKNLVLAMTRDKKNYDDNISFVFPTKLGVVQEELLCPEMVEDYLNI